jgi:hypothetical protein
VWQGPAPRTDYRDNSIHYSWHRFTRWGTGDDVLTELHRANWLDAIPTGAKLNLPVDDGAKTGMWYHLGQSPHETSRPRRP